MGGTVRRESTSPHMRDLCRTIHEHSEKDTLQQHAVGLFMLRASNSKQFLKSANSAKAPIRAENGDKLGTKGSRDYNTTGVVVHAWQAVKECDVRVFVFCFYLFYFFVS